MALQYRIKRRQYSQAVTENNVVTFDLSRGYDIETIALRVTGTANVTTGGTAVRAMAPCQLIKRVELIADGKNTICSIPGWALVKNFGRDNYGMMTPPTAASIAAYAVEMFGTLDQALIDGVRPKDSNLRTSGMSLLQLRITTGACVDLFTGSPAGSMTAFNVEIGTVETVELLDPKTGNITAPLYLQKRTYQDLAVPASNANQQLALPVGNALRGLILLATINGEPSDAVINNVSIASGVDVRVNLPGPLLQRLGNVDITAAGMFTNATAWSSANRTPTGIYLVDLMSNGPRDVNVTNAWDLSKASEAKLTLDVTGGAGYQVTVVSTEFVQ